MQRLTALGISIGLLAGLFTWFSFGVLTHIGSWNTPLVVWVAFAAWACFYAVGGRKQGFVKNLGSTLSGLAWGYLAVLTWTQVRATSIPLLGLLVGVIAFGMCVQARWTVVSFIPGAFVGAASYFGFGGASKFAHTGSLVASVGTSLVVGTVLAFTSERGADAVEKLMGLKVGDPAQAGGSHSLPESA